MAISIDIARDTAWAEYEARYEAARQQAIDEKHCFCRCGCRLPVEELSTFGGPARCPACREGDRRHHFLTPRAVETFDWAAYEPAPEPVATRPRRNPLSRERRQEAEAYVRKAGRHGFKQLSRMHARLVEAGKALTDAQAEVALRSKAADERAEASAVRQSAVAERKAAKAIDINRIAIESVPDGKYGVRDDNGWYVKVVISRPGGGMKGFVMTTLTFGDGVVSAGAQYPGPGQFYRGLGAHLVARVVEAPEAAKALYEQAEAENGA